MSDETAAANQLCFRFFAVLSRPTSGGYRVNGRLSALLELGAGFNPEFTGIENVYLNGSIMGFSQKEMDEKLDDILAFAEIGDFVYQPVKTYSSGMAVRLAFAIYSVVNPDVFVVDEALAVGDAYFVHRCMLRFHDMQKQGKTIILVTHDPSAIKKLCHRAMWIDEGMLRMIGDPSEVVDGYLEHLFSRSIVQADENDLPETDQTTPAEEESAANLAPETSVPNCDRRLGDQTCTIMGVGLYDDTLKPISSCSHNRVIILRMTVRNNSLEQGYPLVAGYIFRDYRGIEIASTNSRIEGVSLPEIGVAQELTIQMRITLPVLYPGSYSITPSVSYLRNNEHVICDRPINAIVLDITADSEMHVLLRFGTKIEVERVD